MTFILSQPQTLILEEIADPKFKRVDIAMTYALAMRAADAGEAVDWAVVNKAIIDRWSVSGLQWIKKQAYSGKCFDMPTSGGAK